MSISKYPRLRRVWDRLTDLATAVGGPAVARAPKPAICPHDYEVAAWLDPETGKPHKGMIPRVCRLTMVEVCLHCGDEQRHLYEQTQAEWDEFEARMAEERKRDDERRRRAREMYNKRRTAQERRTAQDESRRREGIYYTTAPPPSVKR